MSINTVFNAVRQFLLSHFMYADEEWLSGCVEYLTSDTSNKLTETEIKNLAREQWLLNDLKDICPGSLPVNLQRQPKTVLTGKYVLQINAAIDIGTPAYQQYLKLQKVNMENVDATTKFEDKIANHRMIKLYLTDGVQEVTAIEYKTMRNLSCDITPGCKILIKGPIDCRRGMLLLTENTIELLGGEVSDIVETNCLAGLLSSKLGVPAVQEYPHTNTTHPSSYTPVPTLHTAMPPPTESEHTSKPIARVTCFQAFNDDFDVDQLTELEEQLELKRPERDQTNKRPFADENIEPEKKFKAENKPEDYPDDDDIFFNEDEEYLRQIEDEIEKDMAYNVSTVGGVVSSNFCNNTEKESAIVKSDNKTSARATVLKNGSSSIASMSEIRKTLGPKMTPLGSHRPVSIEVDNSKLNTKRPEIVPVQPFKYPINVLTEPYIFIKQIKDLSETEKAGRVFKVKAQILKLLSKLVVSKDGWCLKCSIIDGTGSLDVEFTSDVLSNLVGITPIEMNQLKKERSSNHQIRQKTVEALQNAKDKLQVLYCIIELTILEVPKITNLIPFEATHVDLLKKRYQSTRL